MSCAHCDTLLKNSNVQLWDQNIPVIIWSMLNWGPKYRDTEIKANNQKSKTDATEMND